MWVVGLTAKSSRNFGLLMVTVMSYAAVVFVAVPSVFETLGFTGLVTFYGLFSLLGLFAVRNMPTAGVAQSDTVYRRRHVILDLSRHGPGRNVCLLCCAI